LPETGSAWRPQDLDEVILTCTAALEADPKNVDLLLYRGAALCLKGDFKRANEDLSTVLKIDPKSVDALVLRANAKLALADYEGGIADYSAAISLRSDDSELWSAKANAEANQVIARNNLDPDSRFNQNHVTWSDTDFSKAMKDFDKALQLNPSEFLAYLFRGYIKTVKQDAGRTPRARFEICKRLWS